MNQLTYKELCKKLNISRSTLDRVINNRTGVGEKKRKEILDKLEELNFKPNPIGKALATNNRIKIGVIISSDFTPKGNKLFDTIYKGMMYYSEHYYQQGVVVEYVKINSGSAKEQIDVLRRMEREGFKGIVLSMEEASNELINEIKNLMKTGMKFLFYFNVYGLLDNNKLNSDCYYEIKTDSNKEGKIAAELMAKFIGEKGKVAFLSGLSKNQVHQERVNSARDLMQESYKNIDVLDTITDCYPKEKVTKIIEKLLEDNKDLKGIIASCGNNIEIIRYIKKQGKARDIKIIFFDCTKLIEKAVKDGDVDIVIGVDLFKMGCNSIKAIYDLCLSRELNSIEIDLPILIKNKVY